MDKLGNLVHASYPCRPWPTRPFQQCVRTRLWDAFVAATNATATSNIGPKSVGLLDRPQSCGILPSRDDFSQHYATLTMVVMARLVGEFREASSGEHEAALPIPSLDPRGIRGHPTMQDPRPARGALLRGGRAAGRVRNRGRPERPW